MGVFVLVGVSVLVLVGVAVKVAITFVKGLTACLQDARKLAPRPSSVILRKSRREILSFFITCFLNEVSTREDDPCRLIHYKQSIAVIFVSHSS